MSSTSASANKKTAIISAVVNSFLTIIKIAGGVAFNSTSLLADGIHSLADLATDVFTYLILLVSHKDADETHPYGHGKFETFGTLTLAAVLALTAFGILGDAMITIISDEVAAPISAAVLWIALLSIFANEGLYHYCMYVGRKTNSSIIIANAWHHRTDSLSSIAVLVGVALNIYGFLQADAFAAIVVALLLLKISYSLGRSAFDELVDGAIEKEKLVEIQQSIKNIPSILGVHRLRARKVGSNIVVDVHVDVPTFISVSEGHALSETVEKALHTVKGVGDVTVHIDPKDTQQAPLDKNLERQKLEPLVKEIIGKHIPTAELHMLTFHILNTEVRGEVVLKVEGNTFPEKKVVTAVKKALLTPHTPFGDVAIFYKKK